MTAFPSFRPNVIAPARSAGASYSRPGLLNDLVSVCPDRRRILRRRRKIHEYNTRYFKFREISLNYHEHRVHQLFGDLANHTAPGPMLTGIELFQHRFSGNPENQRFFSKSGRLNRFQVPRFRIIFGDFFSKSFASHCS